MPVALNCWVWVWLTDELEGATAMDCSVIELTTTRLLLGLETLPMVAVICEVPAETPVARPVLTPTVATLGFEEFHIAPVVIFLVLPSL